MGNFTPPRNICCCQFEIPDSNCKIYCQECGAILKPYMKFCPLCGRSVRSSTEQ